MKIFLLTSLAISLLSPAYSNETVTPTSPMENYQTMEISQDLASEIFQNLKNKYKSGSTCSNRAMVWAYETDQDYGVNSEKYFIHYTDVFNHAIHNEAKHPSGCFFGFCLDGGKLTGWEYHVASGFNVEGKLTIMDKYFLPESPVTPSQWEQRFIGEAEKLLNTKGNQIIKKLKKNIKKKKLKDSKRKLSKDALDLILASKGADGKYHITCKKITHIFEHDIDQRKSWCHTQRTNMYYWNQNDLRSLNNGSSDIITRENYTTENIIKGKSNVKTYFGEFALEYSYDEAFPSELRRKSAKNKDH